MSYVPVASLFIFLTFLGSCGLQFYYTRRSWRTIPILTHLFILTALFVCILPFPLLVVDVTSGLYFTATEVPPNATSSSSSSSWAATALVSRKPEFDFMHSWWLVVFIATQLLAWVILPIAQEYDSSGAFTPGARLKQSLKENVRLYIILGIVVGILFGYIIFLKGIRTFSDILRLGIAAANAFGLTLLVIFLSCGLVGLPRKLWRKADPALLLRYYYYNAVDMQEEFEMVKMDLADLKTEVIAMDPWTEDEDSKRKLGTLLDLIDETVKVVPLFHSAASRNLELTRREVNLKYLEEVSSRVRRGTRLAMRLHFQWTTLQRHCVRLDALLSGKYAEGEINQRTVLYWTLVRKPLLRTLSICAVIMTVLVMWSETVLPIQTFWDRTLSVAELICTNPSTTFVGSSLFLFYIASAGYWTIFELKASTLVLIKENSDAASLCFVGTTLTRLILPLCYNFLWMSDLNGPGHHVAYSALFGEMNVVDFLGPGFNRFLPLGIPILCILIEMRFFDKLLEQIGMDRNDPTDLSKAVVRQRITEGRQILSAAAGHELSASTGENDVVQAADPKKGKMDEAKPEKGKRYADWKAKRAAQGESAA